VGGLVRIADVSTAARLNSGYSNAAAATRFISVFRYLIESEIEFRSKPELLQVSAALAAPGT
jgi:hypothetical protein